MIKVILYLSEKWVSLLNKIYYKLEDTHQFKETIRTKSQELTENIERIKTLLNE